MITPRTVLACTLLSLCGVACGGTPTPTGETPSGPGAPVTTATIVSGNDQVGLTGKALLHPLVIRVLTDGVPTAGAAVTWTASTGSAVIAANKTDSDGQASAGWILSDAGGRVTMSASVDGATTAPLTFGALAVVTPSVAADGRTVRQEGVVGAALGKPLRIIATSGSRPIPGLVVTWQTEAGEVYPTTSITGADGSATSTWTLGHVPGAMLATATVERSSSRSFFAAAAAGPPAIIYPISSAPPTPANWPYWYPVQALVVDAFLNPLPNSPVEWSVVTGPAVLLNASGGTLPGGLSQATFAPTGTEGWVEVEARPTGTNISAQFYLTAGPRQLNIRLNLLGGSPIFVSGQNGSSPAVDTIPVGATMTWILDGWDYELHRIAPSGGSVFPDPGPFDPYEDQVLATFAVAPGTYSYWDSESGAMGTIVVQ